jgi:hypothetical protein
MASRDPYANTAKGNKTSVSKEESAADMRKFLTGLSYVVPVGFGLNALRLAYKSAKLGKKAVGLAKNADATVKANRTSAASKLKTKRERAGENSLAKDQAKVAANTAARTKAKARTNAKIAAGAGATALLANAGAGKSKTTTTKTPPTKTPTETPTTKKPTVARGGSNTTTAEQRRKAVEGAGYKLKEKKKYGESGMGMKAYQNQMFTRRK